MEAYRLEIFSGRKIMGKLQGFLAEASDVAQSDETSEEGSASSACDQG